jgi:lysophospholipid acyltransferase (LPLAT)-like uncharacterized protein
MIRKWLKSPSGIAATGWLMARLLWVLLKTIRWRTVDKGGLKLIKSGQAVIIVNWHGRALGASVIKSNIGRITYIRSASRDGRMMSYVLKPFGVDTVVLAKGKQAISGYREIRRRLKAGLHIGITPDGPRGPARMAAPGAIMLAKETGAAIVPLSWSTRRMTRLKSWDRAIVPSFFTQGVYYFGAPIYIPADADSDALERARLAMEDAINQTTAAADAIFGHTAEHSTQRYGIKKEKR